MNKIIKYISVLTFLLSNLTTLTQNDPVPQMGGDDFRLDYQNYKLSKYISEGEASYSGDLNFSIPLLTVPGRNGHDFEIKIDYNSSINQRQFASWVGLGWNLDIGSVERTVNGRTDEPDHISSFGSLGCANDGATYRGNMMGRFNAAYTSESNYTPYINGDDEYEYRDVADFYQMSIDGGGMEIIPFPASINESSTIDTAPIYFCPVSYNPWEIQGALNPTGVLSNFTVIKEDGTNYIFGDNVGNGSTEWIKVVGDYALNFDQNYKYTYRWNLSEINYPDGCTTTIEYAFQNSLENNNPYNNKYVSIMLDRSDLRGQFNNFFCDTSSVDDHVYYEYSHPAELQTDTHSLVFVTSSLASDTTNRNCRLDEMILYDKNQQNVLKRVIFHYAESSNGGTLWGGPLQGGTSHGWQPNEKLKDNQLTLIGITICNYSEPLLIDENAADNQKYSFTYGSNPRISLRKMIGYDGGSFEPEWPGYYTESTFATAWRLKTVTLPTGGIYTYNYETEVIDYDPEGNVPDNEAEGWGYSSEPRCRLASKTFADGIDAEKTWRYDYADEVVYDPPSGINQSSYLLEMYRGAFSEEHTQFYKYFRNCGVGHRWIKVTYPDDTWKKIYYTSSYQEPGANTRESKPDIVYGESMPPANALRTDIITSNAGCRGVVWKEEIGGSASTVVKVTNQYYYTYLTQATLKDRYDYYGLLNTNAPFMNVVRTSIWPRLDSQTTTRDGITKTTEYVYNDTRRESSTGNGLINTITEKGNNYDKSTSYDYAYLTYAAMQSKNMLSQTSSTTISKDGIPVSREYTLWAQDPSSNSDLWLPSQTQRLNNSTTTPTTAAITTAAANTIPIAIYTYDDLGYGQLINVEDANNNITKYYYSSDETNPFQNTEEGLAKGYVTGIEYPISSTQLRVSYKYDDYGNVTEKQDENGIKTTAEYDDLGRLSNIKNFSEQVLKEYTYYMPATPSSVPTSPCSITEKSYTAADSYITTKHFYDGAGNERQNLIVFGGSDIISATTYDQMWRVKNMYKPYLRSGGHNFDTAFDTDAATYYGPAGDPDKPYKTNGYMTDGTGRMANIIPEGDGWVNNYITYSYGTNGRQYSAIVARADGAGVIDTKSFTVEKTQTVEYRAVFDGKGYFYVGTTANGNDIVNLGQDGSGTFTASPGTVYYLTAGTKETVGLMVSGSVYYNIIEDAPGYDEDTIFETVVKDENGNYTAEYHDKLGNLVCKTMDYHGENLQTVFEYDVLGNIIKVVPPLGNKESTDAYNTTYSYNSLGQLIRKSTPDEDGDGDGNPTDETSASSSSTDYEYKYDDAGNLRFILDPEGRAGNYFIYRKYDGMNRLIETGTRSGWSTYFTDSYANSADFPTSGTILQSYCYDQEPEYGTGVWSDAVSPGTMSYLKNRLAAAAYKDVNSGEYGYTYYSYNMMGNIKITYQDVPGLTGTKKVQYAYDLENKITNMLYQQGSSDQFYCQYTYDAAGRLWKVYANTSNSFTESNVVAEYTYNADGQSSRTVYGGTAQGVDYKYNIRGWLTQINHPKLNITDDPGQDGVSGSNIIRDRFGETIGYNTLNEIGSSSSGSDAQYNGNISWMVWGNSGLTDLQQQEGYSYTYDGTNRLTSANYAYYANTWIPGNKNDVNNLTYDANGNIMSLNRYDEGARLVDDFTYHYSSSTGNRLNYVDDAASSSYSDSDIDDQSSGNYSYNANGNLMKDVSKGIQSIKYDFRNLQYKMNFGAEEESLNLTDVIMYNDAEYKAAEEITTTGYANVVGGASVKFISGDHITLNSGFSVYEGCSFSAEIDKSLKHVINYVYDTGGSRVKKSNSISDEEKYYIRDARGNVISVYDGDGSQEYVNLLGSDTFGSYVPGEGYYYYIKDHLGSTCVVVDESGTVNEAYEYYPFGSIARSALVNKLNKTDEKFTGKELDNENGENLYYFGGRYYFGALGRWTGVDPVAEKEPGISPYAYVGNNPLLFIDPNGQFKVRKIGNSFYVTRVMQESYDIVNALGYVPLFSASATVLIGKYLSDDPSMSITESDMISAAFNGVSTSIKVANKFFNMLSNSELNWIIGSIDGAGYITAPFLSYQSGEYSQNEIILDEQMFYVASDVGLGKFSNGGYTNELKPNKALILLNKDQLTMVYDALKEMIRKALGGKKPSEAGKNDWKKIRASFTDFDINGFINSMGF